MDIDSSKTGQENAGFPQNVLKRTLRVNLIGYQGGELNAWDHLAGTVALTHPSYCNLKQQEETFKNSQHVVKIWGKIFKRVLILGDLPYHFLSERLSSLICLQFER